MTDQQQHLSLLREKVEQLGKFAEDVSWSEAQRRSIDNLRKDIGKMFDHLKIKAPKTPRRD